MARDGTSLWLWCPGDQLARLAVSYTSLQLLLQSSVTMWRMSDDFTKNRHFVSVQRLVTYVCSSGETLTKHSQSCIRHGTGFAFRGRGGRSWGPILSNPQLAYMMTRHWFCCSRAADTPQTTTQQSLSCTGFYTLLLLLHRQAACCGNHTHHSSIRQDTVVLCLTWLCMI